MEPRALLNMNGNLATASAPRRSFSAEMTRQMKDELVNTPVRGVPSSGLESLDRDRAAGDGDEVLQHAEFEESGFSTPTSLSTPDDADAASVLAAPATPTGFVNYDPAATTSHTPGPGGMGGAYSPTTPYYLSQDAKLVQMTCPPKQTNKGLFEREEGESGRQTGSSGNNSGKSDLGQGLGFPISGKLGDVKDEAVRKRLAEARRRTMGWRPVVGSPLGR
jgi:hypothetical protein